MLLRRQAFATGDEQLAVGNRGHDKLFSIAPIAEVQNAEPITRTFRSAFDFMSKK